MYTLRKEAMTDLPAALVAVKKIGYSMVESFPAMHVRPVKELRAMVEDAGLTLCSAHIDYQTLESQLEYAHELGVSVLVCPMLPNPMRTREGIMQAASEFNKVGALAKAMNIRFCFHNHSYEFQPLSPTDGKGVPDVNDTGLRLLLEHADPALVGWEEDCFWVAQGGQDPLALLRKYSDRVVMLHLKDRKAGSVVSFDRDKQYPTEIGTGTIDWNPIVKIAVNGNKIMFIEEGSNTSCPWCK